MFSAFVLANRIVSGQARFELVIYKSVENELLEYKEGVCPACNNERTVSVDLADVFPSEIAATLDDSIPCPECADERGDVRQSAR